MPDHLCERKLICLFIFSVFEAELPDIPVFKASIAGTRLVGRMTIGTIFCSLRVGVRTFVSGLLLLMVVSVSLFRSIF